MKINFPYQRQVHSSLLHCHNYSGLRWIAYILVTMAVCCRMLCVAGGYRRKEGRRRKNIHRLVLTELCNTSHTCGKQRLLYSPQFWLAKHLYITWFIGSLVLSMEVQTVWKAEDSWKYKTKINKISALLALQVYMVIYLWSRAGCPLKG